VPSPSPPPAASPVPVPSAFFIAQGFRAEALDAARRWGASHDDRHHPHDWTAIQARRIGAILARFDFIRSIEGQRDRAFEETIALRRQLVKLGGVVLSWIAALDRRTMRDNPAGYTCALAPKDAPHRAEVWTLDGDDAGAPAPICRACQGATS